MAKPKKQLKNPQKKKRSGNVFQEAWENMSGDFDRLMPGKLRQRHDKKKFVLWLFILEIVVLGVIGTLLYRWWGG